MCLRIIAFLKVSFLIVFFLLNKKLYAQCCSPGSPVLGSAQLGIVRKNNLRLISFYRHGESEGYRLKDEKINYQKVQKAWYNYAGMNLSYGILSNLSAEAETGYYLDKSQRYSLDTLQKTYRGFGWNNLTLSLKLNVFTNQEKGSEITLGAGAKVPFTQNYLKVNHEELPRDVFPSTYAYGMVFQSFFSKKIISKNLTFILIQRYEVNFADCKKYKQGNLLVNSFFVSWHPNNTPLLLMLQIRDENREKDKVVGSDDCSCCHTDGSGALSGGNLLWIGPQAGYMFSKKWTITCFGEFPVYQFYNGIQLSSKYAFGINLALLIGRDCPGSIPEKE